MGYWAFKVQVLRLKDAAYKLLGLLEMQEKPEVHEPEMQNLGRILLQVGRVSSELSSRSPWLHYLEYTSNPPRLRSV